MPKMKTHKATAKRLKLTSGGKIIHKRVGGAHLLAKKSSRFKRRIAVPTEISVKDAKRWKKLVIAGGK